MIATAELRSWNGRITRARDDYRDRTKDVNGEFLELGEHHHGRRRFVLAGDQVIDGVQICGCVECSP